MTDNHALTDEGYFVNFLQKGKVKKVSVTLTSSNLTIKEVDSGKVRADVPLSKVSSVKAISRLYSVLVGIGAQGANLKIKADGKTYKIAWKNPDANALATPINPGDPTPGVILGTATMDQNSLEGYARAKLWEDTFNKYKLS